MNHGCFYDSYDPEHEAKKTKKYENLIWKFKEWKSWLSIEGFVGIRSKCYTFKTKNNLVKKTKGVSKVVVKKSISFDDDKNFVLNDKPKNVKINAIRT